MFTLAHVGTLFGSRDPAALWEALAHLRAAGRLQRFRLALVGGVDDAVRASAAAAGVSDLVDVAGYVQHADAVRAMREAVGPDVEIMIDVNMGWSADTAIQAGRYFDDLDVYWLEEPVVCEDFEGYRRIAAALKTRVVGGESHFTRYDLRPFFATLPSAEAARMADLIRYLTLWMVFTDPPEHTRLRRLAAKVFNVRSVNSLRPQIEAITHWLLERLEGLEEFDFIEAFAGPLPALVIMHMLGVPRSERPDLGRTYLAAVERLGFTR